MTADRQLHLEVLDRLGEQGRLDWSRASVDTMSVRPSVGGPGGANPVDRGKPGSKLHLVCDGGGQPLTAAVTAANRAGRRRRGIRPRLALVTCAVVCFNRL